MHSTDAMKGVGARLEGATIQGQYYIEKLVQRGGMAWLYKARHKILQEPMAIKILFPQWSDDPLVRVRFIDEAKIQFKLKHPNIVQVTDVIEDDSLLGIVQEWVDGEDLNSYIQRIDGPMSLEEIWAITEPLLSSLEFAHDMGVVHRDIKPSNVLLGRVGGRVIPKLADFGIAKILDELGERTTTGTTLGTMKYIAPEQIRDSKSVDHRADIYGFGVMLYRMATGQYPFDGKLESVMFKQLYEPPPRPREINEALSEDLQEVILQCLTKHPEDRFPDCAEVLETLRPVMPTRNKSALDKLFANLAPPKVEGGDVLRFTADGSSPGTMHPIGQSPSLAEISAHDRAARLPFADPNSIEELKNDLPTESHLEQTPPPQRHYVPPADDRPPSFVNSPYHQPRQHTMDHIPPHSPSPFAPAEDSPWGEFMLETEDEYEIDDDPTEIPQHNPFADSAPSPVEVRLGSNSTGSFVPFPKSEPTPEGHPESNSSTMFEAAPSPAELQKIGEEMEAQNKARNKHRDTTPFSPERAEELALLSDQLALDYDDDEEPTTPPTPPAVSFPPPAQFPPPADVSPNPKPAPKTIRTDEAITFPPVAPSSASGSFGTLPARLEGSGIFAIQITPSNPSLDAAPAPTISKIEKLNEVPPHENQSVAQEPLSSADFDSWESNKRAAPPIYFYPLIGIVLGLVVLGATWLVMKMKRESQEQAPARRIVTTKRTKAPRRVAPRPPAQADIFVGCKKKWPKDKSPHRLTLTIQPKEMFALHHPQVRDYVKGSLCVEYFRSPTITLSRSGYADCAITLPLKRKALTLILRKSTGAKFAKSYCVAP